MSEPKTYAPMSAKRKEKCPFFCIRIGVNAEKMIEFLQKHCNDRGYVNLELTERREVGKHGETHTISLDTWKPNEQIQMRKPSPAPKQEAQDDDHIVPF